MDVPGPENEYLYDVHKKCPMLKNVLNIDLPHIVSY